MTVQPYDPAGDLAELGELVSGLAADIALIAERAHQMAGVVDSVKNLAELISAVRGYGYSEGAADAAATARAQQARAGFRVVAGGLRSGWAELRAEGSSNA